MEDCLIKKNVKKIVIAEDYRYWADTMHEYFVNNTDLQVVGVAYDGLTAMEMIETYKPDLAILNLIMPYLDGIGILERIKEENKYRPKVIIESKVGAEKIIKRAFQFGADYYMVRPIELDVLVTRVYQVLEDDENDVENKKAAELDNILIQSENIKIDTMADSCIEKNGKRIVIADDNIGYRDSLHGYITNNSDLQVVGSTCDGLEALQMVKTCKPDVILLDIVLSNRDGLSVLEELKKEGKNCPKIIIHSAVPKEKIIKMAHQLGVACYATCYIEKPVELDVLINKILQVLEPVEFEITEKAFYSK